MPLHSYELILTGRINSPSMCNCVLNTLILESEMTVFTKCAYRACLFSKIINNYSPDSHGRATLDRTSFERGRASEEGTSEGPFDPA